MKKIIVMLALLTSLDVYKISVRRGYYPPLVARLFQNKLTARFVKVRTQMFSYLRI